MKMLLPLVANDPERLARFQREARVLASLHHPHIAAIYGLEDALSQSPAFDLVARGGHVVGSTTISPRPVEG